MKPLRAAWLAALALSQSACLPVPNPVFEAGGASASSADGLERVRHSGFRVGWIRQDGWARDYDELAAQFIGISYRRPPRNVASDPPGRDDYALPRGIEEQVMASLAEIFRDELGREGGLPRVQARGPRVLLVRVELVDLVLHVPLARFVPDEFLWVDSAGELTAVIELRDSASDAPLARFAERAALSQEGFGPIGGTPGPVGYEARRIFRGWARNLRLVIDALRERKPASEARSEPTRGSASGEASEGRSPSASDQRVRGAAKAREARSEPTRGSASGEASEGRSPSASDQRVRGAAKAREARSEPTRGSASGEASEGRSPSASEGSG